MPQTQDWFSANAPKAPAAPDQDWFASNAPKADFRTSNAKDAAGVPVVVQDRPPIGTDPRAKFGNMLADAFIGAIKGGGQTAANLGRFVHLVPGVSEAVDALYGTPGLSDQGFVEADKALEPTNTAQAIGKGIEQMAEAFVPSTMAAKVVAKAPAAIRMATEGAAGAATAAVQGAGVRDIITSGAVSAAVPGGSALVKKGRDWFSTLMENPNPQLRDAIAYVASEGVPIDAATKSGRMFVANAQKRAGASMGGGNVAANAQRAQSEALTDLGHKLTAEANPGGASTALTAGENIAKRLEKELTTQADEATKHYEKLRQIEAKASSTRQVPAITEVDFTKRGIPKVKTIKAPMQAPAFLQDAKKNLTPLYEELVKENSLVPLMGDRGRALVALSRIVDGPDFIPLTELDAALGSLKAMARGAELPALRTQGQGTAAAAVAQLERAVQKAAADLGPEAVSALKKGREATIAKYAIQDVRDLMGNLSEPVQVFQRLTQSGDAGIDRLRQVKKLAPEEVREVGQAFLQGMMEKGTAEGVFKRADGLWADWNRIGQATKSALFEPALKKRLDQFFQVAKKIQENPNPSGTAAASHTTAWEVGTAPFNYALAKVMYGKPLSPPEMEGFIRKTLTGAMAANRSASDRPREVYLTMPRQPQ